MLSTLSKPIAITPGEGTLLLQKLSNNQWILKLTIGDKDQPQPYYRFRYETEGQSGAILASKSSSKNSRRYPTVTIEGYVGWIRLRCSCVTAEGPPFRPHPFLLSGQDCNGGVFQTDKLITESDRQIMLRNVGIYCVKLRDLRVSSNLEEAFRYRREKDVNPFKTRWDDFDAKQDGHSVRLCFEAFPITKQGGTVLPNMPLVQPITTNVIHGKLTSDDLKIYKLSRHSASAAGNDELFILCSKVQANDVRVRFSEDHTHWKQEVEVRGSDLHKQYAIIIRVPTFRESNITQPVVVRIQLVRPSTNECSRDLPFTYLPSFVSNNSGPVDRPSSSCTVPKFDVPHAEPNEDASNQPECENSSDSISVSDDTTKVSRQMAPVRSNGTLMKSRLRSHVDKNMAKRARLSLCADGASANASASASIADDDESSCQSPMHNPVGSPESTPSLAVGRSAVVSNSLPVLSAGALPNHLANAMFMPNFLNLNGASEASGGMPFAMPLNMFNGQNLMQPYVLIHPSALGSAYGLISSPFANLSAASNSRDEDGASFSRATGRNDVRANGSSHEAANISK